MDKAESEPKAAMQLNAEAPAVIGAWPKKHEALVVHYSTDYVYDGTKPGPMSRQTYPIPSTYTAVQNSPVTRRCCPAGELSIRPARQQFSAHHAAIDAQTGRTQHRDDQTGALTWRRSIAKATTAILTQIPFEIDKQLRLAGIYHLAPSRRTT